MRHNNAGLTKACRDAFARNETKIEGRTEPFGQRSMVVGRSPIANISGSPIVAKYWQTSSLVKTGVRSVAS